uniref:Uncharacterized protein n=1 Tax=Lutzomyia longipalpis TaxID=7200 RepID=A0A1B0CSV0_LUTLO
MILMFALMSRSRVDEFYKTIDFRLRSYLEKIFVDRSDQEEQCAQLNVHPACVIRVTLAASWPRATRTS